MAKNKHKRPRAPEEDQQPTKRQRQSVEAAHITKSTEADQITKSTQADQITNLKSSAADQLTRSPSIDQATKPPPNDHQHRLQKNAAKRARKRAAKREAAKHSLPREEEEVEETQQNGHTQQRWQLSSRRGGRFAHEPVFVSHDNNEYLVVAQGEALHVMSHDSRIISTLHSSRIISTLHSDKRIIAFDAVNIATEDLLVRVLYSDRTLVDWNWLADSTETVSISTDIELYRLVGLETRIASLYVTRTEVLLDGIAIYTLRGQAHAHAHAVDLRALEGVNIILLLRRHSLVVGRRNHEGRYSWVELDLREPAACFDARLVNTSTDKRKGKAVTVAIGFTSGKIHCYTDILALFSASSPLTTTSASSPLAPRILHWHRQAVGAVKFSSDYLISGGSETVLVLWQLETGDKSFLPHLTAAIERLVVNPRGTRYALQLGDNSVMVLSTSELKPVAFLAGLQVCVDNRRMAITQHPKRKNELLLAVPATSVLDSTAAPRAFLQTYDWLTGVSSKQALTRNSVTDFNTSPEGPILSPDVGLMAMSPSGQWLATVDEWTPPDQAHSTSTLEREVYLKFWRWDEAGGQWQLNSRIDDPHAGSVLRLIGFTSNKSDTFVSFGKDGQLKIWRQFARHGRAVEWRSRVLASLHQVSSAALAISEDGSVIAVGQQRETIFLIDSDTGEIKMRINIANLGLQEMALVDCYLIALCSGSLRIWNLVDDVLHWSVSVPVCRAERSILAINRTDNVLAHASSDRVTLCELNPPGVIQQIRTKGQSRIAAILASSNNERGFLVVYEDASIGMLSTLSQGMGLGSKLAAEEADGIEVARQTPADQQMPALLAPGSVLRETEDASAGDFDDRRVVRPEEIAKIFDEGALPSIKDMFHAVAGLFGRRPRAVAA